MAWTNTLVAQELLLTHSSSHGASVGAADLLAGGGGSGPKTAVATWGPTLSSQDQYCCHETDRDPNSFALVPGMLLVNLVMCPLGLHHGHFGFQLVPLVTGK